jgi:amino acid adenylation domain-containing protein
MQVEKTPDAVAIAAPDQQITYQELNARANQLAHYLRSLGVGREVLVGLCCERSVEMIVGLLGILKAGGAYVPLDPAYPKERIAFMLEDANVSVLLTQTQLLGSLPAHPAPVVCLNDWTEIAQHNTENPLPDVDPENLAYVIYTSGSTGKPKGVLIQHNSLLNYTEAVIDAYELSQSDRVLQFSSISFDVSAEEIYPCLSVGATLVLRTEWMLESVAAFLQQCQEWRLTVLSLPTAYWHELTVKLAANIALPASLRLVVIGGERALPARLRLWQQQVGHKVGQRVRLINAYGPTEATISALICDLSQLAPAADLAEVPIGKPIRNLQAYVLDQSGQIVAPGAIGELYLGGVGLARGYLNRPDLTQKRFIPNPLETQLSSPDSSPLTPYLSPLAPHSPRLYKTGDLVRYRPDGNFEYIGRIDEQVKIRGFRIELGEIETVLGQHPQVQAVVVTAREDIPHGNDEKCLVAYIVPTSTIATPTFGQQLRGFLQERLPHYMTPAAFVMLEALPLTTNGKVDKRSLPVPDLSLLTRTVEFVAPQTTIEKTLVGIWSQVLAVETVGVLDNFWELGGQSLSAIQVISRIREMFGVELSLRTLFNAPTIAELAPVLEASELETGEPAATSIPPVQAISRDRVFPLSLGQQHLWLLQQLDPDQPIANEPVTILLPGTIQVEALKQALNALIQRHESLRTNFLVLDGQPVQVIQPVRAIALSVIDLSASPIASLETEARRLATQAAAQPFDLAQDLLLRATLIQLSKTEIRLYLTLHHLIFDGISFVNILLPELASLYTAFAQGQSCQLPELAIQSVDFAAWQQQYFGGDPHPIAQTQLAYWQQQLADLPGLNLPTDRPRPTLPTFRGAKQAIALSQPLTEALQRLSRQQGVTLFTTLLAAFKAFLHRYVGVEDIVVGTVTAGRQRPELESVVGYLLNNLALRTDCSGNPSFLELLPRVQETVLQAQAHQDLPFQSLLKQLQPQHSSQNSPFQVLFVLEPPTPKQELGWAIAPLHQSLDTGTAKLDLSLYWEQTETELVGFWEYNTDLFEASTIARMVEHFQILLEGVVADPTRSITALPLLSSQEQHLLLKQWQHPVRSESISTCIHEHFEAQVKRTPEAIAVIFGGQQLTYQELNSRANQLAHYLRTLNVKPDTLVGLCCDRSLEMIIGLLSILKAGGAYVPLDPAYPSERLAWMLEDSQVSVLLTQANLLSVLPPHQAQVVCLDQDWSHIAQHSSENLVSQATSHNLAYVVYTSGSTGKPKGVMIEHRSLVNYTQAAIATYEVQQSDRVLQFASISFDASVEEIYPCLCVGATLMLRTEWMLESVSTFLQTCEQWQLTLVSLPTAYWHEIVAATETQIPLPSHLRLVIIGGEKALPARVAQWQQWVGSQVRLVNTYGPTESTVVATTCDLSASHPIPQIVPIGQALPQIETYVLDRHQQLVPIGVAGELYLGGAGLARGYLNRSELTAEKFVAHPFSDRPGAKLYKTGDLVRYRPDGNLEYLGRIDQQVKIRGFRIELGEIEAALHQHPAVQEAVVSDREDSAGQKYLVAYVVPQATSDPVSTLQLRSFLQAKLPAYMLPTAFVLLESLPFTPSGKVDRRALPIPDLTKIDVREFVAPRTALEVTLAGIWAEVLGLARVGITDNFFELGGHSLLGTQVISRVRQHLQVELPLRSLFSAPTIASLADWIAATHQETQILQPAVIPSISRDQALPLSFAQQRLWFLDQLIPNSPFYNISQAVRLTGNLNLSALQQSLNEIGQRHESLRTSFIVVDGQPTQKITPDLNMSLAIADLTLLPATEREVQAQQEIAAAAQQPFHLAEPSLLRCQLWRLSEQEHILLLTMHHIISDAWSIGVLVRELATLYEAFAAEQSVSLPQLSIQYADFAHWQRDWLQGDVLESQLAYWKQQLASLPDVLNLPSDRPRPLKQSLCGATQSFTLPLELMKALQALSQQEGATLFMTLLAAFQTLLYRYSGQLDIVVGSPIANRQQAEVEDLIGFFVNTLVLRTDLSGNPSFQQLLNRVREVALGAYAHQDVPFEQLVEALQPARNLAYTPLFQVMFVLQNVPASELELPGLTLTPLAVDSGTAKFDLTLSLDETERGLVGIWEYNTDLFDTSTIARLTGHFETLLTGIIANTQQSIAQLPLLTPREQQQLVEWNHTQAAYPSDQTIYQWFEAKAEQTPEAIALIFAGQSLTYQELNERSNQLAHYLRTLEVGPEVLVGICVDRSFEMIVGILGILKAGGAYVPLDPKYPAERLSFMLEDTQAPVLLTQSHLVPSLPSHQAQVICLDTEWGAIAANTSPQAITNPVSGASANNLAYVIYTSGSTGKPKGVLLQHAGLCNLVADLIPRFQIRQDSRVLQFASFSFDVSVSDIFTTLCAGATLCLETADTLLPGRELLQVLQERSITTVAFPVSVLAALPFQELPALETLIVGGEPCPPQLVAQWAPGRRFFNAYGPTEATVCVTVAPCQDESQKPPIGQPITNSQIYLLDAQLQPVPIGIPGEIYIGGTGLARGYLNRPDLTAERFIPNPFSRIPGDRLYRTGDLARYLPDGSLEYLGRIDQQVKLRGFRIEIGEIEATLTQHPDVKEAVVLIQEQSPNDKRLIAYVVSKLIPDRVPMEVKCWVESANSMVELLTEDLSLGGLGVIGAPAHWQPEQQVRAKLHLPVTAELVYLEGTVAWCRGDRAGIQFNLTPSEQLLLQSSVEHLLQNQGLLKVLQRTITESLRRFLKQKLPDYMVPSTFMPLSALPLTPNGKVDRRALAASELVTSIESTDTPRTLTEEILVGIWGEVLGLEQVGIHDNFFELGGHSLLATQIISRIRSALQVELPLRNLFEFPTITTLAQSLESDRLHPSGEPTPAILPVARNQPLPLSFPQQQMWLLSQVQTELPSYNYLIAFQLPGLLNPTALEQALNEIIRRHEAWRTNFVLNEGLPVQVIHEARTVQLPRLDLRSLAATERESEALQRLSVEVQRPFDLAADLLLRPYLIRMDETDYRLCLVLHHIIYDGLSLVNFLKELEVLYKAFCARKPSPLPELPIQYADFAAWQRQWLKPQILEPHLTYWKQQLANLPTLQLPSDRPRPANQSFAGHWQELTLSKTLTEQLKALSRREGVTLFMTLQAAFKTLLHRYSGQTDIPVGMIAAEPDRPELKPLIGFFVNFLVLRTDLSGNPSFRDLLQRVREVTLSAYAHREVPFDQLVAELRSQRNLGQNPLYQVMLLLDPAMPKVESGWTLSRMDVHNGMARCDLTLEFHETTDGLVGEFEYSTDLFDAPTITRMMGHFQTLLEGIVAEPTKPLSELSILTASEQQQIQAWNQTQVDCPLDICLHQWIQAQVERTPDAIAVSFADQSLTYRELNARANQLAHYLQKLQVKPETLVGICVDRSLEMVIGLLGILKAGGAYVPFDPGYPPDRLAFMLADAQVPVLLTQSHLLDRLPQDQATLVCLDRDWPNIEQETDHNPDSGVTAENLAYVIYTSGSTGKPKGAMNTHRGICNRLLWMQDAYQLTARDRVLQKTPFSFDVSVWEFFWPLMTGAKLVVARPEGHKDPTYLVELIAQQQITTLHFVPSMLRVFLEESGLEQCGCLRQVMCSGEALPLELQERFFTRLPAQLHNLYGPTEAAVDVTFWHCQPEANQTVVPIGRPIANTQIHLLDQHLQPVPIGVVGELYIGGVNVARGYLNRPELTQERFIPDPYPSPLTPYSSLLYKTGDLARYRPDGSIEYLGRIDHQVKIRGFRIELGEIAAVLAQHAAVREAIAIDRETTSGDKQLVAYLIAAQALMPETQELQAFLQQHLPEYMIPAAFVWLETFPVTANGKLDRQALPNPEPIALELKDSFVAPRTPVEVTLAGIWQEVLGLPQVGVHDNFLALGGHSLLATQVISRSRSSFQVEISLRHLFESPTIAALATAIEHLQKSSPALRSSPIGAVSRDARRVKRSALNNGLNS